MTAAERFVRRGVKRKVLGYTLGAKLGYVRLDLECGHEKNGVQGRAGRRGSEIFTVWRQKYAFCKECKA